MPNEFTIRGRITSLQNEKLAGVQVRGFQLVKNNVVHPLAQPVTTNPAGEYKIKFTDQDLSPDAREFPDLFIRVYADTRQLGESPVARRAKNETTIDLQVDYTPAGAADPEFQVRGTVRLEDGTPVPDVGVLAVDRDLRSEQPLGRTMTDVHGRYVIGYDRESFRRQEKEHADLVVRVVSADSVVIATSPVRFNAPARATVDLVITADHVAPLSEFENIDRALPRLLEDVSIVELEEDDAFQDISFLSGETGFEFPAVLNFALAHRLAARSHLEPLFWYAVLGRRFYAPPQPGTVAAHERAALDALPALDGRAVRNALTLAVRRSLIPAWTRDKFDGWLAAFRDFAARQAVDADQPTSLRGVLLEAGIDDPQRQEIFARHWQDHGGFGPELLAELERDDAFKPYEVERLHATLRLADLTQGNVSLARILRQTGDVGTVDDVRHLARRSEADWTRLVRDHLATGALQLPVDLPVTELPGQTALRPAEAYGAVLARQFRGAFPTTAFAGGLERALEYGGGDSLPGLEKLAVFFDRHESFELLTTPVDAFFAERPELSDDVGLRQQLKAVQRTFKLAPSFEGTATLLADNIHSAQQAYRLGESEFVRRYATAPGFTAETARAAWNRAAETQAAVLTVVGELQAAQADGLPFVLQNNNQQALDTFPNWQNLFRNGDLCECTHCRSVYSPAAYFADLLTFLKDRRAINPAQSVKDVLFARRPDLGFLELNCENANTPLPYIDVVCEVLEATIADGANDLELPGFAAMPADPVQARADVLAAFSGQGVSLGDDFTLSKVVANPADERWVVHGDAITFLLKKKTTANYFAEILRNTKAPADELRANPQYVDPHAYATLKTARYPMALPFDLFNEEARAGFGKIQLHRWELMQTLRANAAPNQPTDSDVAAEYFGLSADATAAIDEKRIVLVADVAGQHQYWGAPDEATMLAEVARVDVFLQKTGLDYAQLLALLDLKFINPNGDLAIVHLDPTCDCGEKRLETLDADQLDRLHRFLRMWRKLPGWAMWELDLAIRQPAIGNGALDEAFLINLMYFVEVKKRLGKKATVEQTLALFGPLNTETRFTKLHEKRADAHYHALFLNKKLIHPLDPAFVLDAATGDLPAGETMTDHQPAIQAALGLRDADVVVLKNLVRASDGLPYLDDALNLANLSFLYRHGWLIKSLKFKVDEWPIVLRLIGQDVAAFSDPRQALEFIESLSRLKSGGFSVDELNWVLAADRAAKAAAPESDAAKFLFELRRALQTIRGEFDAAKFDFLNALPPTDEEQLVGLLTSLLQTLGRDDDEIGFTLATLRGNVAVETEAPGLPAGFNAAATALNLPIRYTDPVMRFTGVMTPAQRTTLLTDGALATYTGLPAYQSAIDELFEQPRLAVKFYEQLFTARLEVLPLSVDFRAQLAFDLASKISYDAEERVLRFIGIMDDAERAALDALSPDPAYRAAISDLAAQPAAIAAPDPRIWLLDTDLGQPTSPATDTAAERMANAALKSLDHLSDTVAENEFVRQASEKLGLSADLTRRIVETFQLVPAGKLLTFFTAANPGDFAVTASAIDYAGFKDAFDSYFWLHRTAVLLKKWKLSLEEFDALLTLETPAQLLDFDTLPLDATQPPVPWDRFLRTLRLLRLRDTLPETEITLLEILQKLNAGSYAAAADFAADVQRLNDAWTAANAEQLASGLDLAYPADYLLAENWERLGRAFSMLDKLGANATTAITFASPTMSQTHSTALKQLLQARFGAETWLTLGGEIQDVLRERKRDALVAYVLHHLEPTAPPPPSGKWENANDVYAYYLLDVEMFAGQLTSRLVQASGSVQLFVQRCHMGLEPDVVVQDRGDDGDTAWRWWKWMRKYRVWEANRKVFLYPENWIEPELRRDKSLFFKDLENELQQNEVNEFTVETAFLNYLEKLDGVAQLEIAGFYHEDDADQTILHVFGRTKGSEPHGYYYRQFDYRRWTPWEKVDLDISADYLVPAVLNKRLFLFWPVFTEIGLEEDNNTNPIPTEGDNSFETNKAQKRLRLQLATSEYRQGKWTPKKVSKDFFESAAYTGSIIRNRYKFYLIDRGEIDGRFGIKFEGHSEPVVPAYQGDTYRAGLYGSFECGTCKGVPEKGDLPGYFRPAIRPEQESAGYEPKYMKWMELGPYPARADAPQNDFALENSGANPRQEGHTTVILEQTPWNYQMTPGWHLSFLDKLYVDGLAALGTDHNDSFYAPLGSWLPFFYADRKRTFFVLPALVWNVRPRGDAQSTFTSSHGVGTPGKMRYYYPDVKQVVRQWQDTFEGQARTMIDQLDLSTWTPAQRQQVEAMLQQRFPELEVQPPYTDGQVKSLLLKLFMGYVNFYLGYVAQAIFRYRKFHFKNFYHPFVCDFAKLINNPLQGVPALMARETQLKNSGFSFKNRYVPTAQVVDFPSEEFYPGEVVDFTPDGAYSSYNWELFYHAPLLIGNMLSKNQRFEEARQWYHYIFNPIGVESATPGGSPLSKYWITKPFYETTDPQYHQQRIDSILRMLAGDTAVDGYTARLKQELEDQIRDWRDHPFEPHRIAQYRTVAYQKTTVMKYLDNLVAWGDNLFRQDSMESINEATQLYILAAEILGPRPKMIPPRAKVQVESFNELEEQFDDFSNALVELENLVPAMPGDAQDGDAPPLPTQLYFCIPPNDKLLGYWDTVADRLYKIRHGQNIEGVFRQLALFEPPIDPTALVKAVAGGVDISSALADLDAPLPLYRFNVLLQKANEVCNDVKALGAALLSALEKKDAEALSLLRQGQEIRVLEAVRAVRTIQIEEAKEMLNGLKKNREMAQQKQKYFESRPFMNASESVAHTLNTISTVIETQIAIGYALSGGLKLIPEFLLGASGFGGSPHATAATGGQSFGNSAEDAVKVLHSIAAALDKNAALASTTGSYERRRDEWQFQAQQAAKEIEQLDRQLAGAELRIAIAERELDNHALQIENARATDEFLRSKYTSHELYQWMIGQVSGVYFQSYRLAYDLAKRAERCLRFELGLADSSHINFGYWDSLKRGLLAGEKLQYDLRRLETAFLEQNRRELELTKHVSLLQLDPLALVRLRETGRCFFRLPEELFDLDYPGHYFRRLRSVSLSLPCITGPYTTVACTLRLLKNYVRTKTDVGDGYAHAQDDSGTWSDDPRFIEHNIPVKAIAASTAQNDSGVFELNFRDDRYLPFEGAGAVSEWALELFHDAASPDFGESLRQFDYATINDAVLHLRYTAREDNGTFKNAAVEHLRDYYGQDGATPLLRLFNLRQEFPTQWRRFLQPANPADGNVLEFALAPELFAYRDHGKTLKINTITLLARCADAGNYAVTLTPVLPTPPPANAFTLAPVAQFGGLRFAVKDVSALGVEVEPGGPPTTWSLRMTRPGGGNLQDDPVTGAAEVGDLMVVVGYEWE